MVGKDVLIGLDIGSISVKVVALGPSNELIEEIYKRHNGLPYVTVYAILRDLCESTLSGREIKGIAVTGSGGEKIVEAVGGVFVNEIIAHANAVRAYYPEVRTAIEMGGQESKLLHFDYDVDLGELILKDFSMNDLCAAGTGSFLDQQASRLGISIEEEFGQLALRSAKPPRMAGRCSVFAKSDMIHLQQIGTPDYDIIAGLCFALARNFKSTIGKGKEFNRPISFQGGVAANAGMIRAFEETLGLEKGEFIIPQHFKSMGAIGAVLTLMESSSGEFVFRGLEELKTLSQTPTVREGRLPALKEPTCSYVAGENVRTISRDWGNGKKIDAYLGIDVGSVSTNVVVIDADGIVLAKSYLPTAGKPICAVQQGLEQINSEVGNRIRVRGVGTTGSGRYLIGDLVGADLIKNEITAQATAAIAIDPTVDTIFEIGGQDSKYISIDNQIVVDFEMNKACAAGTGSFLEEQSERLDIKIKEQFGNVALDSKSPIPLGDRCTVFMESDLIHHQQKGAPKEDLVSGLAYSIVHNYINRVVSGKRIGKNIFFQGGVASNKSVVAAFGEVCGTTVTVPPDHEVTGAIGVALLARDGASDQSSFKGFDFSNLKYEVDTFECKDCANLCEIRTIKVENEEPLYYGSRCEKYDVKRANRTNNKLPNLFQEREKHLFKDYFTPPKPTKGSVGIPLILSLWELLPMWRTFFQQLGFDVNISGKTTKAIIRKGVESVVTETCFPIKVAHGHILQLLESKPDLIFLPSIINMKSPESGEKGRSNFNCPYVQSIPYVAHSALDFDRWDTFIFKPVLYLQRGRKALEKELLRGLKAFRCTHSEIRSALTKAFRAQQMFSDELQKIGRRELSSRKADAPGVVLVSRPYNGCDSGISLDLPKKLLNLGIVPIPMDMLPLEEVTLSKTWERMYWVYGQRILKAAQYIRDNDSLYPLYITNFSCGPDSFITSFFDKEMGGKPHLQIEVDEHSADAGIITRCEAFLDTIKNANHHNYESLFTFENGEGKTHGLEKTVYLPYMGDHSLVLTSALRHSGIDAQAMAPSNEESIYWGRQYTSEKECYPAVLTIGDMIRQIKTPGFDPDNSAFFMPSADGPCRFGQYNCLHRIVLHDLGFKDIPVVVLDQDRNYHNSVGSFGDDFQKSVWRGIVCLDLLQKTLLATRPYESESGECDTLYEELLALLLNSIEQGGEMLELIRRSESLFSQIETTGKGSKPLVGIVGEIYVRSNEFSNDFLIRSIEQLGGEVIGSPVAEWLNYVTHMRKLKNRQLGQYIDFAKDKVVETYMHSIEQAAYNCANRTQDCSIRGLFDFAEKYLSPTLEGEAVLTVGRAVELIRNHGVAGIINAMPFTCMPGTIVAAILKRIKNDSGNVPMMNMLYAGQRSTSSKIKLEAFMFQVKNASVPGREKLEVRS